MAPSAPPWIRYCDRLLDHAESTDMLKNGTGMLVLNTTFQCVYELKELLHKASHLQLHKIILITIILGE